MTSPTTIFITGANAGLGLYTVKALCRSSIPYTIILGSRSVSNATNAIKEVQTQCPGTKSTIEPVQVDISSDESINSAFETISGKYDHIDVLLNNAGAQLDQQVAKGTLSKREMWNKTWDVNVAGTYIVTETFAPLLLKSSHPRLLFIASGTSTLTEHENTALAVNKSPPAGWPKEGFSMPAYRSAKTGMNMMMREWVRTLKEDGVKVFAVSPGFLATGLGGMGKEQMLKMGAIDPNIGAELVRDVVEGKRDNDVGKVVRKDGVQPW